MLRTTTGKDFRLMRKNGVRVEKVLLRNAPMRAVDFDSSSLASHWVLKAGAWGIMRLGEVTGRCYLQTIVGRT